MHALDNKKIRETIRHRASTRASMLQLPIVTSTAVFNPTTIPMQEEEVADSTGETRILHVYQ
jgi:hypothetical protein